MSSTGVTSMFTTYKKFEPSKVSYGNVKANSNGKGKNVPILYDGKPLRVQTPLTFNWGANELVDESTGAKKFSMNLQLEKEGGPVAMFYEKMNEFQSKILGDAVANSKEWFGKSKMSEDVVGALFYNILKYPKNKETDEPDESRNPSMKIKLPYWQGKFNLELYDMNRNLLCNRGQDEEDIDIMALIPKASHVSAIIECGGVWFAAGRFGVTWKFVLGKVRPPTRLQGYCLVEDSEEEGELEQIEEREKARAQAEDEEAQQVDVVDSEPEQEVAVEPEPEPEPAPAPKKKKVVRKKKTAAAE